MKTITKVIRSGNAQTVKIPSQFKLPAKVEVIETSGGLMIVDPAKMRRALKALRSIKK